MRGIDVYWQENLTEGWRELSGSLGGRGDLGRGLFGSRLGDDERLVVPETVRPAQLVLAG